MSRTRRPGTPPNILRYGQFFGDSEIRRELPGFSLSRITASRPAFSVPDHTHETAHAVLVLDGPYVTSAERLEPGRNPSLVWNPAGTTHCDHFRNNRGGFFVVSFSDAQLDAAGRGRLPARPIGISSGPALRVARRLVRRFESWPRRSMARAEALCHELLAGLFPESLSRIQPPPWLESARATLASRYGERIQIGDVADAAAVHPVHLIRSFQRFFGRTPGDYLRERRLEAAATLLRTTDLPLVEIALTTGFADQSHFSRTFRRGFRLTPAAFRRDARKQVDSGQERGDSGTLRS